MKKFLIVLATAAVSSLVVGVQAFAEPFNSVQPTCADITSGHGSTVAFRDANGMTGSLGVFADHDGFNGCDSINFTMVVVTYSARTGVMSSLNSNTIHGGIFDASVGPFHVAVPLASYACVFFMSSTPRGIFGGTVLDVAPDNGCPLTLNLAPLAPVFPFNVMPPGDDLVGDKSGFE